MPRPRHPMPPDIRIVLTKHQLMAARRNRPPYRQNDHIRRITAAKPEETRLRRLVQMLNEHSAGDRYMKMSSRPKRSGKP